MIDGLVLVIVLTAAAAAGVACLRVLGALPGAAGERLVAGLATGLGLGGTVGLGLAALGQLRVLPLVGVGVLALLAGGRDLGRAVAALGRSGIQRRGAFAWALLAVCAVLLAGETVAMLAPPVGGDQTKYHLVYARLYAAHGGLVSTPWSFWGQMQFLQHFLFAIGFALRGDVLARFLSATFGVLAAFALAGLTRRRLGLNAGAMAAVLFFTLPITWSLMTRAGSDLGVVLYGTLATDALLEWIAAARDADLRRAGVMAGLSGACKAMGLLVPALVGVVVLIVLVRRALPPARAATLALGFGLLALVIASPCYVRNAVDTGNPLYPFGYTVFGGRHWSRPASEYLADYYRQYQTTYAARRQGSPYGGMEVARFAWDLTMHPDSFENAARQSYDVGPFALAFAPALLLVRRRRVAILVTAGVGLAYAGIIAGAAWAHPRYVIPGVVLFLTATVPAARALVGARLFPVLIAVTVAGDLALTTRLLRPLWHDQLRVALGRLAPEDFLRRHEPRYAFWERANAAVGRGGRILVLEKIPHPYYIERPFVLASYLEQGLIDYRLVSTPEALATKAADLGVTYVAVDVPGLDAAGDPFEATVGRLWRAFLDRDCEPVLRDGNYALYALRPPTAFAAAGHDHA